MKLKTLALGLAVALGISGAAVAKTVTFDFAAASSGGWSSSLQYAAGGLNLTVTGKDTSGQSAKVQTWKGAGLGVKSATDCFSFGMCFGTDHQIDTNGRKDIVQLAFSKAVRVTQIAFSYVDKGDTFDFYLSGSKLFQAGVSPIVALNTALSNSFGIGAGVSSSQSCLFRSGRPWCQTVWNYSAFKLKGITVDTAAVPVPAAGLLLVGGLGALTALRRKRRAA